MTPHICLFSKCTRAFWYGISAFAVSTEAYPRNISTIHIGTKNLCIVSLLIFTEALFEAKANKKASKIINKAKDILAKLKVLSKFGDIKQI